MTVVISGREWPQKGQRQAQRHQPGREDRQNVCPRLLDGGREGGGIKDDRKCREIEL